MSDISPIERLGDLVYAWSMDNGTTEEEANDFVDRTQEDARDVLANMESTSSE